MATLGQTAAVFVGSGLGGVCRWLVTVHFDGRVRTDIPVATLLVNTGGSLIIGFCAALLIGRAHPSWVAFWMVGVLGGFTTFSAYSLQIVELVRAGRAGTGLVYAAASVLICVLAAAVGLWLGRLVVPPLSSS